MNREIKFRGKRIDNGEWVYGSLLDDRYIVFKVIDWNEDYFNTEYWWRVIPETVGQFTGLYDSTKWESLTEEEKNDFLSKGNKQKDWKGKEIYEGDIVREHCNDYTPIYQNAIYMAYNVDKINDPYVSTQFNVIWRNGCEVIGNIHDNQELLNE